MTSTNRSTATTTASCSSTAASDSGTSATDAPTRFSSAKRWSRPVRLGWASGTWSTLRNTGPVINAVTTQDLNAVPLDQFSEDLYYDEGYDDPVDGGEEADDVPAPDETELEYVDPRIAELEQEHQLHGFSCAHEGGVHVCLVDGSVRFLNQRMDQETYRRLGNRDDGELIGKF